MPQEEAGETLVRYSRDEAVAKTDAKQATGERLLRFGPALLAVERMLAVPRD